MEEPFDICNIGRVENESDKLLCGKELELCTGFSMVEGVCAEMLKAGLWVVVSDCGQMVCSEVAGRGII